MNRFKSNPWAVLLVLCTGFFMILLDTTIVNIAIPSIIDDLAAPLDQILWVMNAYVLVYAVLLITAGRLGDLYGQRNLFALGMAIFILSSAYCGLASDINHLILARVIQGVGGALLTPQTLAILTTIFPSEKRGVAFGVWGGVAGLATITGPIFGGFLVSGWSWRWVFYINVPIGVIALIATFLIIPDLRPGRRHGMDLVGVSLASAGLFALVFGLIEGQRYDWGSIWGWVSVPALIMSGVLILIGFVVWERFQEEPLIPLSLFEERNFSMMNLVGGGVSFGLMGFYFPLIIYAQSVLGFDALGAGLIVAPSSLAAMIIAPNSGRLSDKIGGKYILMFGLILFAIGVAMISMMATPTSSWQSLQLPLILTGIGQGCVFAPMTTVALRHVSSRMAGASSGVLNTSRQLGMVVGSAIAGAVLQNRLVVALNDRAVADASQLPADIRQRFIDGIGSAMQGGLDVGRAQGGGLVLPPGIPPQAAEQVRQLFHDVFVNGFTTAMSFTMWVPVLVLLIGAVSCLAVDGVRSKGQAPAAEIAQEQI